MAMALSMSAKLDFSPYASIKMAFLLLRFISCLSMSEFRARYLSIRLRLYADTPYPMPTSVKIVGTHLTPPSPRRATVDAVDVAAAAVFGAMIGG